MLPPDVPDVLVIGGGPAGLRAAEVARAAGASVLLCDAQSSVGRKFLVAGRGGLNLTHGEPVENFPQRYGDEQERWRDLLGDFSPDALRDWAEQLSVETYVGTSGRVFPRGQKAAILLRAWVQRLRGAGVEFRLGARLLALTSVDGRLSATFNDGAIGARTMVLALGGASWPDTGSDGTWPALLASHGIEVTGWQPANCGWTVDWPEALLARAEGLPLKNLSVTVGDETVSGELLITRYGLEGGAIYRHGRQLRAMSEPQLAMDLKPQLTAEALLERLARHNRHADWPKTLKLSPAATALLETLSADGCNDAVALVRRIKGLVINLRGPRPIAEAISSAGGIAWSEINEALMLRKLPGIFVAGEMIDWEAPTGGYLLQGCFSTGTRAGRSAAELARVDSQ
jgi:uncharacterized flavoprotein (TIGR03862 family)